MINTFELYSKVSFIAKIVLHLFAEWTLFNLAT